MERLVDAAAGKFNAVLIEQINNVQDPTVRVYLQIRAPQSRSADTLLSYVAGLTAIVTVFDLGFAGCSSFLRPRLKRKRIAVKTAHPNRTPNDKAETMVRTKVAALIILVYSDGSIKVLVVTRCYL